MNNRIWLIDALHLHFDERLSRTEVGRNLGIPDSTIFEFFTRFHKQGIPWPLPEGITCEKLEGCLYPGQVTPASTTQPENFPAPDSCASAGKRRRRPNFPQAFRLALVAQSMQPGVSVAQLARENDINANLLFNWRQRYGHLLHAPAPTDAAPPAITCDVVPVVVQPPVIQATPSPPGTQPAGMHCEITVGRARIRLSGDLTPTLLRTLLRELKGGGK
ncbi:MAG: IS66-like element accessory protein TnpA [Serratia sp. (in: enterobacteria)]|uniref:IS66-like element accessory protein TnpA n=1 Tax=Serratia sp. (in: enterobacteria) TaxID=616 RepID=UPI003F2EE739